MASQITVVITNFKRPEHLKNAVNSCIVAGVENVVISASGEDESLRLMHDKIRAKRPQWIIDSIAEDKGCNEMWLRGVRRVTTPWVHILHDDDRLLPEFKNIEPMLNPKIGFIHWPAWVQRLDTGANVQLLRCFPTLNHGVHRSDLMYRILLKPGTYAVSPGAGLFRTADVIETLEECEPLDKSFRVRPGMMIGNDLLIWLRAVEKHDRFLHTPTPMIAFGQWDGSTTAWDIAKKRGGLIPLYDRMRNHFVFHPRNLWNVQGRECPVIGASSRKKPTVVHCLERHVDVDPKTIERKSKAFASWDQLYSQGVIKAHHWDYKRDSSIVGDDRGLPFLKDVLAGAMELAAPNDIIMLTNDDTIVHPGIVGSLNTYMSGQSAIMAHRCGFRRPEDCDISLGAPLFKGEKGEDGGGWDMFAFKPSWLRRYWGLIPDYLMGSTLWDVLMGAMIRKSIGVTDVLFSFNPDKLDGAMPLGFIGHISHPAKWCELERSGTSKANRYNNHLAKQHMAQLFRTRTIMDIRL